MLLNLHKKSWVDGLKLEDYKNHCNTNETVVKEMLDLARNYHKVIAILNHLGGVVHVVTASWLIPNKHFK